ncbi:extracellular solute-binding protein [Lapidilactobacillus salsurivasis]
MKIWKKIGLTMLSLATVLALGACGKKAEDKTIVFWNPLTGDDGKYMNNIVADYNKTNPEYKVKAVVTSDMYTKINTVMNSGKGVPDMTIIHADRIPGYVKQGLLEPITTWTKSQKSLKGSNYLSEAWNAGTIDGKQYSVPLDIHSSAMYYNKDLLKKYGVEHWLDDGIITIPEMLELKGKMKKGDYVVNDALISWVILAELNNAGGDVKDADDNPTVNTPEMKKAIEAVKSIADAGLMTKYGTDGYLKFQSQHVLLSTDGTWTSTAHSAVKGLNFGVTNVYSLNADKFTNRGSSHEFTMLKKSKEERSNAKEKGIAKFVAYMRKHSIEWAKAGQIPASKQVNESKEYKDNYMQAFFTSTPKETESLKIYTYVYYPEVQESLDKYAADMVHGKMDVDKGLAKAQKYVDDKVKEAEKTEK